MLYFALLATAAAISLRDIITKRSDLTTFARLLDQFEIWEIYEGSTTDVTVLAPNDAAYDKLLEIGLDIGAMPADFSVPLLRYHLSKNRIKYAQVVDETVPVLVQTALTLPNMTQPSPVKLFAQGGHLHVETGLQLTSQVVEPDIEFAGGVIHVLDASLVAPHNISASLLMHGISVKFLEFMEETGLVSEFESLHDATVFLPSNEAWKRSASTLATMDMKHKRALLRNHAVKGLVMYREELGHRQKLTTVGGLPLQVEVNEAGKILVQGAAVIQTDVLWFNGVAHLIDGLMMLDNAKMEL